MESLRWWLDRMDYDSGTLATVSMAAEGDQGLPDGMRETIVCAYRTAIVAIEDAYIEVHEMLDDCDKEDVNE